jgi:hypothetical protein
MLPPSDKQNNLFPCCKTDFEPKKHRFCISFFVPRERVDILQMPKYHYFA